MRSTHLVASAFMLAALVACGGPAPDATGHEIYMDVCARCHRSDLGGGVGPALGPHSEAADQSDEFLVTVITDGRGRMPSFRQTLSTAQIERVVSFLRQEQDAS